MIVLLAACSGEPDGPSSIRDTSGSVEEPSPWEYEDDPEAPDHDLPTLQAGLDAGLVALQALDAAVLYDGYAAATSHATTACPGLYPAVGVTTAWSNECTTPDGWGFSGRGQAAWLRNTSVDGQSYAPYGEFINTATLTHPTGVKLSMDGRGTLIGWMDGSTARMESTLLGTFAFTGEGDEGWLRASWLDSGPSVALEVAMSEAGAVRTVTLEGGIAADGIAEGIVGVRAEGLAMTVDGACDAAGDVVLLGDAGQRYRASLVAGGGCEPCVDLTRTDRVVGEVCLDLSPFVAWSERPW